MFVSSPSAPVAEQVLSPPGLGPGHWPSVGLLLGLGSLATSALWCPMPVGHSHMGTLHPLAGERHSQSHGQNPEALALLPGLPLVHPRLFQSLSPSQLRSPGHRPSPEILPLPESLL